MKIAFALTLAAVIGATPAHAQRDDGSYGRPQPTPENMQRLALFGSSFCANRSASATASKVLASGIASSDEAKHVKTLRAVARQCYKPEWPNFASIDVRNALAEIDYRAHFKNVPLATAAGTPPPESFAVAPAGAQGSEAQQNAWYLAALANCVVFVDAPTAHNLVIGPGGVPEEQKRFDKLGPALTQCGSPATAPGLSARVMRGYLANALLVREKGRVKK